MKRRQPLYPVDPCRLELERIETIEQVINRLAPRQPRGLAAKYREDEITKHIQARRLPVRARETAEKSAMDAHDRADKQDFENISMGSDATDWYFPVDGPFVGLAIVNN